jgi:hypothetical protein
MKLAVALLPLVASCVWSPAHQSSWQSSQPLDVEGYASQPGAVIHIKAWNYRLNELREVAALNAATTPRFEDPDMYRWRRVGLVLGRDYWIPPAAPCSTGGMAQLRVYEGNATTSLPTFTAAAQDCVLGSIFGEDNHPARAGRDCTDADQIVLFDFDGVCP